MAGMSSPTDKPKQIFLHVSSLSHGWNWSIAQTLQITVLEMTQTAVNVQSNMAIIRVTTYNCKQIKSIKS